MNTVCHCQCQCQTVSLTVKGYLFSLPPRQLHRLVTGLLTRMRTSARVLELDIIRLPGSSFWDLELFVTGLDAKET